MLNSSLKLLNRLSNRHEFCVKMLSLFCCVIITREAYHDRVITIYSKRSRDTLHNVKLNNKIFQPNCLTCSLVIYSTSMVEVDVKVCLKLFQETTPSTNMNMHPSHSRT